MTEPTPAGPGNGAGLAFNLTWPVPVNVTSAFCSRKYVPDAPALEFKTTAPLLEIAAPGLLNVSWTPVGIVSVADAAVAIALTVTLLLIDTEYGEPAPSVAVAAGSWECQPGSSWYWYSRNRRYQEFPS